MLKPSEIEEARIRAVQYYDRAGLVLTEAEKNQIEIADFGLSDLYRIGLEVLVYVNTERVCAKELVMFPGQTCPEHIHPTKNGIPGKEETFRCRWGKVHLYVSGPKNSEPFTDGLDDHAQYLKVAHEVVLLPGEQYTIMPDTWHWFRSGEEGAVVSEFSTMSTDDQDIFSDPRINRFTVVDEA
ncbi:D-lyxose/D-mannose family sugar isomerase [Pollutibacter soli]|uniref:D-lyxose/D-mannose family sugar isomerase n=1 Tax=Pollutibacter soli TaxID=3034157 RepID=UPI003013305D